MHFIRYGLLLGEIRKGHFLPDHALALVLMLEDAHHSANFSANSDEIAAYWQGRDFPHAGLNGWLVVHADGFVMGWGMRVNGRIKNHYPRGLRRIRNWY